MKSDGFIVSTIWVCSQECAEGIKNQHLSNITVEEAKRENIIYNEREDEDEDEEEKSKDDDFIGIDPVTGDPITRNNQ